MAKAYLGKISALVTANTSDFNSKLNASAKEVRSFASSMQSALNRAETSATSSLRGIYTEAQKLERALKAASSVRLSFKGVETGSLDDASRRLQQLFSVTQSITKPLEASSKAFGGLSAEVQAGFLPALISAQKATESITATINKVGSVGEAQFAAVERKVIETTAAISRLREASSAVGSLATGQELRFQRPDFVAETQRSAALQSQISQLPPQQISGGGFADLVSQQRAAAVETERLAAALERAKLARNGDAAGATRAYEQQIALQRQLNDQIEREVDLTRRAGEATSLGGQRSDVSARLQAARAAQEEAAFRERSAEATEKQVAASNRLLAQEIRRREVLGQQQQAFGAGVDTNIRSQAGNIFGGPRLEAKTLLAETERLAAAFNSLDAETRSLLQPLANRLNDAYQAALKGSIGVGAFADRIALLRKELELVDSAGLSTRLGGESTDISAFLAATKAAQEEALFREQAARAAQEEALFTERAAEQAERVAKAAASARAVRDNFGAGIDLGPQQAPEQLFGRRQRTRDSELERTRNLDRQFQALPDDVQASLAAEAKALNNIAAQAQAGAAGVETLASANDRMAASIGKANASLDGMNARTKLLDDFKRRFADFDQVLQTRAISAFTAELEVMERAALSLGANVRGPVVAAMNAYRDAVQQAMDGNTFDSPATKASLKSLRDEFVAAAKQAGMSADEIAAALKRANSANRGDIGRLGIDKTSLALNQLAFAIDDFFSSTGGLEFKLRAVSNNITQLGFIVGGTTGLFVSLGAVVAGQVAAGIAKFVFETDKADAALTALNAALEANQRNVEQLAESYRRLADEIAKATLSPRDNLRRDRDRQRDDITRQRRAAEEEAFASLSPEVARVRGEREILKKQQQESNSVEERVRIAKQIRENLKREQEILSDRGSQEAGGLVSQAADREVAAQRVRLNRARARRALGSAPLPGEDVADLERTVAEAEARRAAVRGRRLPGATTSSQTREQLSSLQQSLSQAEQARADLVNALPPRTPGTRVTAVDELDETIQKLKDRIEVVSAVLGGQLATELIDANFRIQDALSQAAQSLSSVGIESALAKTRDRLSRELTAIADELASVSDPARAEALRKQQEELEKQSVALRSAASSVERFAAVIDRVAKQLSDTVLQEVEGRANQARREANAARGAVDAGVANVPAFNRPRVVADQRRRQDEANADRRRAEADVQRAQAGQQEFEQRRRRAVRQFEARAAGGTLGQEAQGLIRQRDQAQAVLDSETATVAEQQQAAETLARVNARLEQLFQNSSLGVALAEFADGLDAASQAAAELDRQIREQRASADRGRELTLTPGERAAEELNQQIADIREYATRAAEESSGLPEDVAKIRNRMNEAIGRAEEDMMRQIAPTIMGMADAVQNAVLQGPSRAALNASDVTTSQGQQELNRLLRGDDPAREVDLVALQREAIRLLEVIAKKEAPVAG